MQTNTSQQEQGFTFIEILCSLAIIGLLTVVLINGIHTYTDDIKTTQAQTELHVLGHALRSYHNNIGVPITSHDSLLLTLSGNNSQKKNFLTGYNWNVIENKLIDPWGNPYLAIFHSSTNFYEILSCGPNGIQESKDIFHSGRSDDIYR